MSATNLAIHTDPKLFDTQMICEFLSQTYWAEGRSLQQVKSSIENSECFGVFLDGKQIGFGRVLTDRTVFAYLMDVFILPEFRNRGHAMTLMQYILDFPEFSDVQTWLLKTRDAHSLYEKLGFTLVSDPESMMTLKR